MFNNFQRLVNNILENMNSVGDTLMSGGEATGSIVTDPNIKMAMALSGSPKKKKKKLKVIRRNLQRKSL
jgi:tRNA G37 N-methylase TrmD